MIEGKKINLRTFSEADIEKNFELSSIYSELGEFWPIDLPVKGEWMKRYREDGWWTDSKGIMAIVDKEDNLVGHIGFFRGLFYQEGYEIGYRIFRKSDRGKGYMSEALKIFSAYLFELKPIQRLQVNLLEGNIGSRRVAEKCGFVFEGKMREAVFHRGKFYDLELLSMLRRDSKSLDSVLESLKK